MTTRRDVLALAALGMAASTVRPVKAAAPSGQLTIGSSTPDPDGKTVHQEFDVMQPDGKTQHIKSTLGRDGADAYDFSVFIPNKAGEWVQAFKIRYERK